MLNKIDQDSLLQRMHLIKEYSQLSVRPALSTPEADRLAEILRLALTDPWLNFLIQEADHAIGHSLGLLDDDCIHSYQNQQAVLKEFHIWTEAVSTSETR